MYRLESEWPVCFRVLIGKCELETTLVRAPRADEAGGIYHALNCRTAKNPIFFKAAALEKFSVDLLAYHWMKNHWMKNHCRMSIKADSRAFGCKTMPPFLSFAAMLSAMH